MGSASRAEATLTHWWARTVGEVSGRQTRETLDELLARHREPHRRYHTASHVLWVLRHADSLAGEHSVDDISAVFAAAFFHDAIYDPAADQPAANERASAALAARRLEELGWTAERIGHVREMIEATATHQLPDETGVETAGPERPDMARRSTEMLLDADLAVLGAGPAAYDTYVTGVRAEYAHVDDDAWRLGRRSVLERFLARDTIYATAAGRRRWEARARANITAELMTLRPTGPN